MITTIDIAPQNVIILKRNLIFGGRRSEGRILKDQKYFSQDRKSKNFEIVSILWSRSKMVNWSQGQNYFKVFFETFNIVKIFMKTFDPVKKWDIWYCENFCEKNFQYCKHSFKTFNLVKFDLVTRRVFLLFFIFRFVSTGKTI